jgi:hypothetical protein
MDHLTFNNLQSTAIQAAGNLWGVIDHSVFNGTSKRGVVINHTSWLGVGGWGDNSWAQPDTMGTEQAMFVETNQFNILASESVGDVACDTGGGRCVARFNNPLPYIGTHGTDSGQRLRSVRQYEVYNNTITDLVPQCEAAGGTQPSCTVGNVGALRGGTAMMFNNTITPTAPASYSGGWTMETYRLVDGWPPWGAGGQKVYEGCDGEGPFDQNGSNNPLLSGTAGPASVTDTLSDPTQKWTPGQWVGNSLRNLSNNWGSYISANTTTTITTLNSTQDNPHKWAAGNTYHINQRLACLGQPGHGANSSTTYISGGGNGLYPSPLGWPNEILDPIYAGNNTCSVSANGTICNSTGQTQALTNYYPNLVANKDFYDYDSTRGGAVGVGVGTLAQRPSSCTAGVGYWATDQGSWNNSGKGGQGELFVCTSTNTWTLYYTPYTYPHPLVTNPPPPAPPTDLKATPH